MKREENPQATSKYKYLLGSEKWLKTINNQLTVDEKKPIYEKQKYFGITFDEKKIIHELNYFDKIKRMNFGVYLFSKYSSKSMKEICTILNIVSPAAGWRRLSRFKEKINNDKLLKVQLKKFIKENI